MTVYELIQRLSEAPADMEVVVNVVADDMEYTFEDRDGRDRTIGVDFDKRVEICDAYTRTINPHSDNPTEKMVIDLYAL